jgi:hypothetical protein
MNRHRQVLHGCPHLDGKSKLRYECLFLYSNDLHTNHNS